METYPYALYWTDVERIKSVPIHRDTSEKTHYTYSINPRARTEFSYYNDEGEASYKTFVLDESHDLGVDAVPQLVDEEVDKNGRVRVLGYKVWIGLDKTKFEEVATKIYQRGIYTSREGDIMSAGSVIHKDKSPADLGRALPFIQDERGFQYIRTALLFENAMKGEVAYYPLTVLALLVGHNDVSFLTPDRMEYNVLRALKSDKFEINRGGSTTQWISAAHDVLGEDVRSVKGSKRVVVMEVGNYGEYLGKLSREKNSTLYVLSRKAYTGSLDVEMIDAMRRNHYEYRGIFAYKVRDLKQTRYIIYYFDKKAVGAVFPPILHEDRGNTPDAPAFPPEAPFEYSDQSTGKLEKKPYYLDNGSLSWTGDMRSKKLPIIADKIDIDALRREGDYNRVAYYFQVLVAGEDKTVKSVWKGDSERSEIVKTVHNPLTNTLLHIYRGGLPTGGRVHTLVPSWSITRVNGRTYCFTMNAHEIDSSVWKALKHLQRDVKLIHVDPSSKHTLLSYSSLIRHWGNLRYSDGVGVYDKVRSGSTLQLASRQRETTETIATLNRWDVYAPYSLPVQTENSPVSLYPLPIIQPVTKLQREDNGDLVWYERDEKNALVVVRVEDGEVVLHDPFGVVDSDWEGENGIYEGRVEWEGKRLVWKLSSSKEVVEWSPEEIIDYISAFIYKVTDLAMMKPPQQRGIKLLAPCYLGSEMKDVSVHAECKVRTGNYASVQDFCAMLGRSDPALVRTVDMIPQHYNKTTIGDVNVYTEARTYVEYEFSAFAYNNRQILENSPAEWTVTSMPKRVLAVRDDRGDNVLLSYYQEVEEEELEISCIVDDVLLYARLPKEWDALLAEYTPKELLEAALESDEPAKIRVSSRIGPNEKAMIDYLLTTM
jgi:hypothetical protein